MNQPRDRAQSHLDISLNSTSEVIDSKNESLVEANLSEIISLTSPNDQRREMYKLLDNKKQQDVLNLIDDIMSIESVGTNRRTSIVQGLLFERLVWLEPSVALDHVWRLNPKNWAASLSNVFTEWSLTDIDGAMAAASTLEPVWKLSAFQAIFESRGELSHSVLQALATKWNANEILNVITVKKAVVEMIDRPKEAIKYILNAEIARYNKVEFVTAVVDHWIENKGVAEQVPMLSVCVELITQDQLSFSHLVPLVATLDPKGLGNIYEHHPLKHNNCY